MFKSILGKMGRSSFQSLCLRNSYRFYNEVPKFDHSKNYYGILEVAKNSSDAQIKQSYYRLAKVYHPDSNPGQETKFKEINEAYSVLSDQTVKKQYDSSRLMRGFSRRMGNKASEGNFHYQQYSAEYENLSPEEKEQLVQEFKRKVRKAIIFGVVMILLVPFLTRRNHRYYVLDHGQLVPVQFQGGMMGGMMPQPGMPPHGSAPYPAQGPPYPGQGQYPPPGYPYEPNPPQGNQLPYRQQYIDPYSEVIKNVGPSSHPSRYQSNVQSGYQSPTHPQ